MTMDTQDDEDETHTAVPTDMEEEDPGTEEDREACTQPLSNHNTSDYFMTYQIQDDLTMSLHAMCRQCWEAYYRHHPTSTALMISESEMKRYVQAKILPVGLAEFTRRMHLEYREQPSKIPKAATPVYNEGEL